MWNIHFEEKFLNNSINDIYIKLRITQWMNMNVFKHIIELTFIFFQPWRFNWREWFMARLKSSFYVSWSKIQIQTASIALRKANVNPQWIYGMWFTNRTGKNGKTFWVIVFEFNDFSITFICIDIITILIIFSVVIVVVRP